MPSQEYRVVFFGAPGISEGNGIIVLEGQITGSTILAKRIVNNTKGGTFVSDSLTALGGVGWDWPPLENPIGGRIKDIEINLRTNLFTIQTEVESVTLIHSNCPEGCLKIENIYWNPVTTEIVVKTEEKEDG